MQILSDIAREESTYIITIAFEDEDGSPVVPNNIKWSLLDTSGNYINSRQNVVIASPAASNDIVLSEDDLAIQTTEASIRFAHRRIVVEADYDGALGSGLPINDVAAFAIENFTKIT